MIIYHVFGIDPKNIDVEVVEADAQDSDNREGEEDDAISSKISRDALNSILEQHTKLLRGMQEDIDNIANNQLI